MTKFAYEKPALRAHGSVEAITKGGQDGDKLDDSFMVGTAFADLTFS